KPQTEDSRGSKRPRRARADGPPSQKRPVSPGSGPRRFRDHAGSPGAGAGHSPHRHSHASQRAPRAEQAGPPKTQTPGVVAHPPSHGGRSQRPTRVAPPAAPPPRSRRIVGLEPESPTSGRPGTTGRSVPVPMRPPRRKPRLRRPERRTLRGSPGKIDE